REQPRLADAALALEDGDLRLLPGGRGEDVADLLELVAATDEAAVGAVRRVRGGDHPPPLGRAPARAGQLLARERVAEHAPGEVRDGDLRLGRAGERLGGGDERGEPLVPDRRAGAVDQDAGEV